MTKITATKLARALWRDGTNGKGTRVPRITGFKPAQPRELVTCKGCGAEKLLSVGQIWRCKHPKNSWNTQSS